MHATTINERYVDTTLLGTDMLDGYFRKPFLRNLAISRKIAYYVDYLENFDMTIRGIPVTSVKFDTWDSPPFEEHGAKRKPHFKDEDENLLWHWKEGKTAKELGIHRQKLRRILKKFVEVHLEHKRHASQ